MKTVNNTMIWLISDQMASFEELINDLSFNGYECKKFIKISDALEYLNTGIPDAIIIDADQKEVSCMEFCYRLKISSLYKKVKIFVFSSNMSESMEASMFDAGADEFVPKPIRLTALLKRISRRLENPLSFVSILFKNKGKSALQIDKESFSVYLNQILVPLSRKEFELLYLLACNPGKVFSREEIFNKVWKRNHDSRERTIDVHILRLRKKIGEEFFSTQKGVGYRFSA